MDDFELSPGGASPPRDEPVAFAAPGKLQQQLDVSDLPHLALDNILGHLSTMDWIRMSEVSPAWKEMIRDSYFWRRLPSGRDSDNCLTICDLSYEEFVVDLPKLRWLLPQSYAKRLKILRCFTRKDAKFPACVPSERECETPADGFYPGPCLHRVELHFHCPPGPRHIASLVKQLPRTRSVSVWACKMQDTIMIFVDELRQSLVAECHSVRRISLDIIVAEPPEMCVCSVDDRRDSLLRPQSIHFASTLTKR